MIKVLSIVALFWPTMLFAYVDLSCEDLLASITEETQGMNGCYTDNDCISVSLSCARGCDIQPMNRRNAPLIVSRLERYKKDCCKEELEHCIRNRKRPKCKKHRCYQVEPVEK